MKKTILLIVFIMSYNFIIAQTEPTDNDDNGYRNVSTLSHLQWISENSSSWDDDFELDNDINAADTRGWNDSTGFSPIGNSSTKFTGIFDGKGYAIDSLYIYRGSVNYIGLFGAADSDAEIKNLGVTNTDITGYFAVGGMLARAFDASIFNCYSSGEVNGYSRTGGLIGIVDENSSVKFSHSSSDVYGTNSGGDDMTGGLIAFNDGTVSKSFSTGNVSGKKNTGGFVGWNSPDGNISNCFARGNVNGITARAGGFCGHNYQAEFTNCFSTGEVTGSASKGGFNGYNEGGTISNCYWDTESSGLTNSSGGSGKTTSLMKTESTFSNWDFDYVWDINSNENDGYPFIREFQELDTVELYSPSDESTGLNINITLSWNEVDNASDYVLNLSASSDFSSLLIDESDITSIEYDVSDLDYANTYYWRVKAMNEDDESDWSEVWQFTTRGEPLVAPTVVAPADSSYNLELSYTFSWNEYDNANQYRINISRHPEFDGIEFDETTTDTSILIENLDRFSYYFWRVKVLTDEDSSYWSDTRFFTTKENIKAGNLYGCGYYMPAGAFGGDASRNYIQTIDSSEKWLKLTSNASKLLLLDTNHQIYHYTDINDYSSDELFDYDTNWKDISTSTTHSLAIKKDGSLWAWGDNEYGQLGDGTNTDREEPVLIDSGSVWTKIVAAGYSTYGIKSNGSLWVWGLNSSGQLGDETSENKNIPVQIEQDYKWKGISSSGYHSIAIRNDNTLWSWGNNYNGQLGDNTNTNKNEPVQVGSSSDWMKVFTGSSNTFAINSDGYLFAFGSQYLGDSTSSSSNIPVQIGNDDDWFKISSENHTVSMKEDGKLYSWGYNYRGQLALGNNTTYNSPQLIFNNISKWTDFSTASNTTRLISYIPDLQSTTLLEPENYDVSVLKEPTFKWNSIENADEYRIQIIQNIDDSILLDTTLTDTSFTKELNYSSAYSWRVRGENDEEWSDWTDLYQFKVVNNYIWELQNPLPTSNTLNDIVFLDTLVGYAVGGGGTIIKTTDGGETWLNLLRNPDFDLVDAEFINKDTGFVVGHKNYGVSGVILRTTNGGLSFSTNSPEYSDDLGDLWSVGFQMHSACILNDSTWYAAGGPSTKIYKTTDYGSTWVDQNPNLNSAYHIRKIIAMPDSLNVTAVSEENYEIYFYDSDYGWRFGTEGKARTTDGGENWESLSNTTGIKEVLYFSSSSIGYAYNSGGGISSIFKTTNGGLSWVEQVDSIKGSKIVAYDENTLYAIGSTGYIAKSTNFGEDWTELSYKATDKYLMDIEGLSRDVAWVVGSQGEIVKTTDGGENWEQVSFDTSEDFYAATAIFFYNENTGWITGEDGLYKTTNSGNSWTKDTIDFASEFTGIYFIDENTGFLLGNGGKTTDGGETWEEESNLDQMERIVFLDENNGFAYEDYNGYMRKTTDGGENWESLTAPGGVTDMEYLSEDLIYITVNIWTNEAPTGRRIRLYKSTTGGYSWTQITERTAGEYNQIHFTDPDNGWLNHYGSTYKTTDGGSTWTEQYMPESLNFYDMEFVDDYYAWGVGPNGGILRYKDTTVAEPFGAPQLISPSNNADDVSFNPQLKWKSIQEANNYRLQVSNSDDFSDFEYNDVLSDTTYSLSNLDYSTTYYWRARAYNYTDTSSWSSVWSFTTSEESTSKLLTATCYLDGLWDGTTHSPAPVSVELRSGDDLITSTLDERLTGLIQSNGTVEVDFSDVDDGDYWVVVRSAGYLPLGSTSEIALSSSGASYDFTDAESSSAGGARAVYEDDGDYICRTGDLNYDRKTNASDAIKFIANNGKSLTSYVPDATNYTESDPSTTKELKVTVYLDGLWDGTTHAYAPVSVELYSGADLMSGTFEAGRTGMLNSSGEVAVNFGDLADGDYWVVVRSAGYLPLGSTSEISLSSTQTTYDFTDAESKSAGGARAVIEDDGDYLMRTGDMNFDRKTNASDAFKFINNNGKSVTSYVPAP
jgi:photosystem II stability/assembly factor-like uncharacterized protein/alpha-tubulin suppressor-like RCC1 family protein